MFDLYLEAAKGKTIYLDVIIESEYDPMEATAPAALHPGPPRLV